MTGEVWPMGLSRISGRVNKLIKYEFIGGEYKYKDFHVYSFKKSLPYSPMLW